MKGEYAYMDDLNSIIFKTFLYDVGPIEKQKRDGLIENRV